MWNPSSTENFDPNQDQQPGSESDATVTIYVNSEAKTCLAQASLLDLLTQLNLNPRLIAVEYNGEILHRQLWPETHLKMGDRLEIVTIVGGG
jgi:sulfur carrier protein